MEQRGAGGWKWSDDLPVVAVIKQWYSAVLKPMSGMSTVNTAALTTCTSLCLSHVTWLQCMHGPDLLEIMVCEH